MSAAPHARTLPASASVVVAPVKIPTLSCTEPWSLAVISLLVHELRGVFFVLVGEEREGGGDDDGE